ncbi:cysteine hydrolase family protein [Mycoplasma hafezii]|uniref:cysteine hydrolase family protein n=1 Tax=Mycoplasma hafezii TaxID=525886 RepID=UPI003CE6F95A
MLKGFADFGPLASENVKNIVPIIKQILESAENNLFICDAHAKEDLEMNDFPIHCIKGSREAEVVDELKEFAQKYVYKNTTNAFFELNLDELKKFDTIKIVGCCTDICVLQLVLTLQTYFYNQNLKNKIIVYSDAVATYDSLEHNAAQFQEFALSLMKNAGVIVKKWK